MTEQHPCSLQVGSKLPRFHQKLFCCLNFIIFYSCWNAPICKRRPTSRPNINLKICHCPLSETSDTTGFGYSAWPTALRTATFWRARLGLRDAVCRGFAVHRVAAPERSPCGIGRQQVVPKIQEVNHETLAKLVEVCKLGRVTWEMTRSCFYGIFVDDSNQRRYEHDWIA